MDLRRQTVQGIFWTGISWSFRFFLQLGITAILARLLVPEDFGLVVMPALIVNFLLFFRGAGLGAALIQRREVDQLQLSSVFWYVTTSGILLSLVVAALSPVIAWIYDEPRLVPLTLLSAANVFINSLAGVHSSLLARDLKFKTMATRETAANAIAGVAAVWMAYEGFGVYALALQSIAAAVFSVVFIWTVSPWRPDLRFRWAAVRDLLGFGASVTGFQVVNFINRNVDRFMLARFVSPSGVAFYDRAYQIVRMPVQAIHDVVGRVLFPSMTKVATPAKAGLAYLDALRYITLAAYFPVAVALVLAPEVILILYGPQWTASIVVMQLFAITALQQVVATTTGWLYRSQGKPGPLLRLAIMGQPLIIGGVLVGLQWGLVGVALAYLVLGYLFVPTWTLAFRLVELRLTDVVWALRHVLLAAALSAAAMATVAIPLRPLMGDNHFVVAAAAGPAGLLAYLGSLWVTDRALLLEARKLVGQLRGRNAKPAL